VNYVTRRPIRKKETIMRFGTVLLGAAIGGVYAAATKGDIMKSALWGGGIGGALTLIGGASVSLGRARVSVSGAGIGKRDFFAGFDPAPEALPLESTMPYAPQEQFAPPAGYPWW
jgi:hypothetical protein